MRARPIVIQGMCYLLSLMCMGLAVAQQAQFGTRPENIRPRNFVQGSSWQTWIDILDQLAALKPVYVLPDHGEFGDASLLSDQRAYLLNLLRSDAATGSTK